MLLWRGGSFKPQDRRDGDLVSMDMETCGRRAEYIRELCKRHTNRYILWPAEHFQSKTWWPCQTPLQLASPEERVQGIFSVRRWSCPPCWFFRKNFACKLNSEVQALYFGGSRKQVSVHACVAYTAAGVQSYANTFASLRHDKRAVWAHLEPVIWDTLDSQTPRPTTLLMMSDGPVTRYRNKKTFTYLLPSPSFQVSNRSPGNSLKGPMGKAPQMGMGVLSKESLTLLSTGGQTSKPLRIFTGF